MQKVERNLWTDRGSLMTKLYLLLLFNSQEQVAETWEVPCSADFKPSSYWGLGLSFWVLPEDLEATCQVHPVFWTSEGFQSAGTWWTHLYLEIIRKHITCRRSSLWSEGSATSGLSFAIGSSHCQWHTGNTRNSQHISDHLLKVPVLPVYTQWGKKIK